MPIDTYNDAAHSAQLGGTSVTLNSGAVTDINASGDLIAVQFDAVQVQNGETITAATLYVESTDNDGGRVITQGDDSDNATALSAGTNDISGRTRTTASVEVEMTAIGTKAIDVTTELQEIVNRGGWANLNRVVFILEGASPSNDQAPLDLGSANMQLVVNHPLSPPASGYTLTGNTTYSAIAASIEDDDTIDLAGYELDIDAVPTETGITVESPGSAGTVVFSVVAACNISTWDFTAGTGTMIATLPANVTVGTVTGGTVSTARGVLNSYGSILLAQGGDSIGSEGCNNNFGLIVRSLGGGVSGANGCQNNYNVISTAEGGVGGTGVANNNATVVTAIGGSDAAACGITNNYAECRETTDNTGRAVGTWYGDYKLVNGPAFTGEVVLASATTWSTLYSIGTLSGSATLPGGVTVIELSEGGGGAYNPFNQSRVR